MIVFISNPIFQTQIFTALLVSVLFIFSKKRKEPPGLSLPVSSELKGFAILAIVLAHIGYFLVNDTRFLFPLSVCAGIGVNVFLFLSGYGLTHSALQKNLSLLLFYKKRLIRIFVPLWIILVVLFIFDALFLHIRYSWVTVIQSFLGFFPSADLYQSLDAPLWYLTLTLFFYLIFPFVFLKKNPFLSAMIFAIVAVIIGNIPLPVSAGVRGLYATHLLAFPLGVFFAGFFNSPNKGIYELRKKITHVVCSKKWVSHFLRFSFIGLCLCLFGYTSLHAGIGKGAWIEQGISLISMGSLFGIFIFNPFQNKFLYWVGVYSYEIYLIHWPILYRYDFLYRFLPAGIATFLYLMVFLIIGWLFQKLTQRVLKTV